jgi:hypothetical protein
LSAIEQERLAYAVTLAAADLDVSEAEARNFLVSVAVGRFLAGAHEGGFRPTDLR